MNTIFDKSTREGLINRITVLNEKHTAQWGKMNVYQMVKHCTLWEEMIFGKIKFKQSFIGFFFGRMALKSFIKDDTPLERSIPSSTEFIVKENTGDLELQKENWITLINEYQQFSNFNFVHPFFGKMTKEQIGVLAYKHTDHHLRQFNA